jgi:pimeloyl-ACP methyl ester carboxylesterase
MPIAKSGDLEVFYGVTDSGDPMMLIMGLGADQSVWEMHRAAYAEHFQCFDIDNRGIGRTSKPGRRYTTAEMAEDVRAVMDHPCRPRPCRRDFDGWSNRAAALNATVP